MKRFAGALFSSLLAIAGMPLLPAPVAASETVAAPLTPDDPAFLLDLNSEYEALKQDVQEGLDEWFGVDQTIGELITRIQNTGPGEGVPVGLLTSAKAASLLVPERMHDIEIPAIPVGGSVPTFDEIIEELQPFGDRADVRGAGCLATTAGLHTTATAVELLAVYPFEEPAAAAGFVTNLATKCCRGLLLAPDDLEFTPEDESDCSYVIEDQRVNDDASWLFYFPNPFGLPETSDWGDLGTPLLYHYNSDYTLRLASGTDYAGDPFFENVLDLGIGDPVCFDEEFPPIDDFEYPQVCVPKLVPPVFSNPDALGIVRPFEDDPADFASIELPIGRNTLRWRGNTLLSLLDFLYINFPEVPDENPAAKKINAKLILEFLKDLVKDQVLARFFQSFIAPETDVFGTQRVTVFDITDPVMTSEPSEFLDLEGLEIGGASLRSYGELLESAIVATDSCDRPVTIVAPPIEIWPVNETVEVTWTGFDLGPNPQGERNSSTVTQTVRVIDTKPPILRRPEGIVAEYDPGSQTPPIDVNLRAPEFFDLVDANPTISSDALDQPGVVMGAEGPEFPAGVTRVLWTAVDQSGNESEAVEQIVNIKEEGTNSAPSAMSLSADAPWFEETTLTLEGSDPDSDPLNFRISQFPENGFFVAPLFPYFVEDFRIIDPATNHCTPDRDPAQIVRPEYVEIVDDGRVFILGASLVPDGDCVNGEPFPNISNNRITVLDEDGNYITGRDLPRTSDLFGLNVNVEDGTILYPLFGADILKLDIDTLETIAEYRFPAPTIEQPNVSNAAKAAIDANGVLYARTGTMDNGAFVVEAWDFRDIVDDPSGVDVEIERFLGFLPAYPAGLPNVDLEVGSDGSLYIAALRSITKYAPATIDEDDNIVLGDLIGWTGGCSGGTGCQISQQRSFGYSCTPETCEFSSVPTDQPGQFRSVAAIALDPNDNLYVPDYLEERIQRFTPEGFFAGVAESNCDQEDRCFVLGDFGQPSAVSVNSEHFHVLDSDLSIVHVFETSVITPVDDTTAEVTYKSDAGFFSATDSFAFTVNDGLDESAPATVDVNVGKRAPIVTHELESAKSYPEDQPIDGTLSVVDLAEGEDFDGTFEVFRQPDNGSVSITGSDLTYTPDLNFFGDDDFEVQATDADTGLVSEPYEIQVTLTDVNDAPVVSPPKAQTLAGIGFPFAIRAELFEVDPETELIVEVDWGDGTTSASNEAGSVVSIVNVFGDNRVILAGHTYDGPAGTVDVEVCVTDRGFRDRGDTYPQPTDESQTDCATAPIEVVAMSGLRLSASGSPDPLDVGDTATYVFELVNESPEEAQAFAALLAGGDTSALNATGVTLRVPLPAGTELVSSSPDAGSCTEGADPDNPAADALVCDLGTLAVGESTSVEVVVRYTGAAFVDGIAAEASADQNVEPANNQVAGEFPIACDPGTIDDCVDALICNGTESCSTDGICQAGIAPDCNDTDLCTQSACSEPDGCVVTDADADICSDGDACNGEESCVDGSCNPGEALGCEGVDECNAASCDESGTCTLTPLTGGACTSGCVSGGICVDGECMGTPLCDPDCETCLDGGICGSRCGVPLSGGSMPTATDALFVLRSGIGLETCGLCACDINGDDAVTASDALLTLSIAIGGDQTLDCPAVFALEYSTTTLQGAARP